MKFLMAFFWSGLVLAVQCASSENCAQVEIGPTASCPKQVCSNGIVYRCRQTRHADGYKTCNMGEKAVNAHCEC